MVVTFNAAGLMSGKESRHPVTGQTESIQLDTHAIRFRSRGIWCWTCGEFFMDWSPVDFDPQVLLEEGSQEISQAEWDSGISKEA